MPRINRRHFLQFAGTTLGALGLSQFDIMQRGDRFGKAIAQSTPRKLALLVGINEYTESSQFSALKGCVTDVELQRHLLIHRFNFNPKDIYTLTDTQATRQGILQAFEEHLIKQAKPGDVVVFHYSGHGSRVVDPDKDNSDGLNGTLVPIDSQLPPEFPAKGGIVQDIMGHTLFLLMSALQTENTTFVLDSCYSGAGTRGNFRIRSRDGGGNLEISDAEKAYQQQWLSKLKLSPEEFIKQRRRGVAKGVVIAAAERNQTAADASFDDFYAGAFTYLMTQYMWQQTGTVEGAIANITRDIKPFSRQVPLVDAKPQSGYEKKPIYFISAKQSLPAEAVITEVKGNRAKLWLGGLDRDGIAAFTQGSIFTIANTDGRGSGQVTLKSRSGLTAEAILATTAKPGTLLQEVSRAIPNDLELRIGLDPSLGKDASAVKQALQGVKRIEAVPHQTGYVPFAGEIQYILGRITESDRASLKGDIPPVGSIGLFSPSKDELLPGSFGEVGETGAKAVARLEPKFKSLLAVRIVKMTLNAKSSRLNVSAVMMPEGESGLIAEAFTVRGGSSNKAINPRLGKQFPLNKPFQFQVTNNESGPLYLSILVIDPTGGLIVLFPNQWRGSQDATRLEAGQTLLIPDPNKDDFQLLTQSKGIGEALIIASQTPLKKALLKLQSLAAEAKQTRGPLVPEKPVEVVGDLLDDLSSDRSSNVNSPKSRRNFKTADLAALSITFEVV